MSLWRDVLVAVAVAAVSLLFTAPDPVASSLAVALSAPLAIRRTHPALALVVATAAAVAHAALVDTLSVAVVTVPVLVHSFARWERRGLALTAVGIALAGAVIGPVTWHAGQPASTVVFTVSAYVAVVAGVYVAGWSARERAAALEQAARAQERAEIAREVHDVVAHSLSMIAVQAEGASARPDKAADVLAVIAEESRRALNEIRDMVGMLRRDDYRPAPGLDDVEELVERLGERAELRIVHNGSPIGPVLGLTVYRVVQESLTNFVRHAGPQAKAEVTVVIGADTTDITVRDDGRGAEARPDGRGQGLRVMRERVRAHNGTLVASAVDGGFEVRAVLPTRGEPCR
ncbi:hypothetical protein FKR81_36910 [Lentzea tibetensis]|uniref:histidine kinase n=1 Tax=Lentzea tibetensis TaxID=2591470 RepID=A0A563EI41_9PSEU|nr:histidine kinase [Lentzea tibetensis]TWP46117.1 hypothetical protein FKR81_36910 [Lentzea tibetensis]